MTNPTFPTGAEFSADFDSAQARASALFDMVRDPADWKAPIEAWIDAVDYRAVADAVSYFTATDLSVVEARSRGTNPGRFPPRGVVSYRVKSIGYRAGPAGP